MPAAKAKKAAGKRSSSGLTAEERAALKETMAERKRGGKGDGAADLRAKVAAMPQPDRGMAERLHAIVMAAVPGLQPKTWYGMPAWAKDGQVLCFFTPASKFKTRYSTFGFSDEAILDEGAMWPVSFALKAMGAAEEAKVAALVKKAAG